MRVLLRELKEVLRYLRTATGHKRIVFYAEHEGYQAYFEGILRELTERHETPLCYVTSDPNDPVLTQNNPLVATFFLRRLLPFFFLLVRCRALVMTLTDLHRYHLKRSVDPSVHYVYVFHSLVSAHMMYLEGAFDHYDSVLCVGEHHERELRALEAARGQKAKELVRGGYYRLDRIRDAFSRRASSNEAPSPRRVLIAPSWGEQNLLRLCGRELIAGCAAQGYQVTVRPHPEILRRTPEVIEALQREFAERPEVAFELSVATDDSLLEADVLICDCSGVALEYAFGTERPVLFLDVPYKIKNPNYEALGMEPIELGLRTEIGVLHPAERIEEVPAIVEKLIADREQYRERIRNARERYVFALGRSSQIGAEHVLAKASGGAG